MPQKLLNELPGYFPESLAQRGRIVRLNRDEGANTYDTFTVGLNAKFGY
ncbi:hypothetical protein [Thiohalophilus sp.]|nr:hypothetical protein [Thiohalophilus sp.]MDZ7663350.1 hypothetical protein [Thiohalophilus sp.]